MDTQAQAAAKFAGLRSGWQATSDINSAWQAQQAAHAKTIAGLAAGIADVPGDWDADHLAAIRDAAIALAAAAVAALATAGH